MNPNRVEVDRRGNRHAYDCRAPPEYAVDDALGLNYVTCSLLPQTSYLIGRLRSSSTHRSGHSRQKNMRPQKRPVVRTVHVSEEMGDTESENVGVEDSCVDQLDMVVRESGRIPLRSNTSNRNEVTSTLLHPRRLVTERSIVVKRCVLRQGANREDIGIIGMLVQKE